MAAGTRAQHCGAHILLPQLLTTDLSQGAAPPAGATGGTQRQQQRSRQAFACGGSAGDSAFSASLTQPGGGGGRGMVALHTTSLSYQVVPSHLMPVLLYPILFGLQAAGGKAGVVRGTAVGATAASRRKSALSTSQDSDDDDVPSSTSLAASRAQKRELERAQNEVVELRAKCEKLEAVCEDLEASTAAERDDLMHQLDAAHAEIASLRAGAGARKVMRAAAHVGTCQTQCSDG